MLKTPMAEPQLLTIETCKGFTPYRNKTAGEGGGKKEKKKKNLKLCIL
jgi:hypothetical protein